MNESRTSSMLQRVPVILAVTAASYGLQLPQSVQRVGSQPSLQQAAEKVAATAKA